MENSYVFMVVSHLILEIYMIFKKLIDFTKYLKVDSFVIFCGLIQSKILMVILEHLPSLIVSGDALTILVLSSFILFWVTMD